VNTTEVQPDCQIKSVHLLTDGARDPISPGKFLRLFIRKLLGPRYVRFLKSHANDFLNWFAQIRGKPTKPPQKLLHMTITGLKSGDKVQVRSREQIEATLDHWGQVRGCSFATEMAQFCGTTQRVLKIVERFVDERDFRVRKASGIILLEGVICQGTANLGRCDRSCYYFWREEWLEKLEM